MNCEFRDNFFHIYPENEEEQEELNGWFGKGLVLVFNGTTDKDGVLIRSDFTVHKGVVE